VRPVSTAGIATGRTVGAGGWGVDGVRLGVPVTVTVPATSANLGPGFDSFGLALALHDVVTVEAFDPAGPAARLRIDVTGESADEIPRSEDHLVVRSVRAGLEHAGACQPGLQVSCVNVIPHGRGLGSSAAAVVAGLVAARGLLQDSSPLEGDAVFTLTARAEGHPDNAAAAAVGGFVVAWTADGGVPGYLRLPVDPRVRVVVCLPRARLATSVARAVLPPSVPHADAAFTAARAAMLVEALTRRPDLLWEATHDRLHQAQRAPAMPATAALVAALRERGAPAVVSGAGPAVLVLCPSEAGAVAAAEHVRAMTGGASSGLGAWDVLTPSLDALGGRLVTP
jgi:homoserine kinase